MLVVGVRPDTYLFARKESPVVYLLNDGQIITEKYNHAIISETDYTEIKHRHYGLSCKKAMVKIRLELGCDLIMNCKDLKHHQIATRIGLADEHALY